MTTENAQVETGSQTVSAPVEQPSQTSQPTEKMVPQSQVNKIAHERHQAGYEKGKSESQQEAPQNQGAYMTKEQLDSWYKETRKFEEETRRRLEHEAALKEAQRAVEDVVKEVLPKLKEQGSKLSNFDEITADVDLTNPGLLWALKTDENRAEIAYELGKDPVLEDAIMRKLNSDSELEYKKGMKMLKTLSESIANNKAAQARVTKSPLSVIKPSGTGADNGRKTISDLRKIHRV